MILVLTTALHNEDSAYVNPSVFDARCVATEGLLRGWGPRPPFVISLEAVLIVWLFEVEARRLVEHSSVEG